MKTFASQLKELSDFALTLSGTKQQYSEKDMFNATLVFFEVFSSLMFDNHKGILTQEQLEIIAEEAGKSINQTIQLFTGVDLKDIK